MSNDLLFFDFSKLKPNGYHYVAIKFSLPYAIHLPNNSYDLIVPVVNHGKKREIIVQVILEDRWRNQEEHNYPFKEEGVFVEKARDIEGKFRYTNVLVCIPIGSNDKEKPSDIESIWNQITRTREHYWNLAIESVNRFLAVYRFNTKEFHVTPITGRRSRVDFVFGLLYNKNLPTDPPPDFLVKLMPINYWGDLYSQLTNIPDSVVSLIQAQLLSRDEISLAENLILNAYAYLDRGEYRLAIIEAETAFETAIHQHLQNYFSNDSKILSEIDESRGESFTSFVRRKNIRPAFDGKKFIQNNKFYDSWFEVKELRNALVHGDKKEVTAQEAVNAVNTIEQTLTYLIGRSKTKLPFL